MITTWIGLFFFSVWSGRVRIGLSNYACLMPLLSRGKRISLSVKWFLFLLVFLRFIGDYFSYLGMIVSALDRVLTSFPNSFFQSNLFWQVLSFFILETNCFAFNFINPSYQFFSDMSLACLDKYQLREFSRTFTFDPGVYFSLFKGETLFLFYTYFFGETFSFFPEWLSMQCHFSRIRQLFQQVYMSINKLQKMNVIIIYAILTIFVKMIFPFIDLYYVLLMLASNGIVFYLYFLWDLIFIPTLLPSTIYGPVIYSCVKLSKDFISINYLQSFDFFAYFLTYFYEHQERDLDSLIFVN